MYLIGSLPIQDSHMLTKFTAHPACLQTDGVAYRRELLLYGPALFCEGLTVIMDPGIPVPTLLARLQTNLEGIAWVEATPWDGVISV
ncbi:hypothetical protein A9K58_12260 [Stenotrophomonas maltophilia]|uniref:Uncharacterized protein n=1 Tax=Stenotrophomonas maltophilia TaxID=40324 RepID=A0A1A6XVC6_STEMA|nr:hypothetical protein A9K58_12260 [Stenotrophomonas maltophilia]